MRFKDIRIEPEILGLTIHAINILGQVFLLEHKYSTHLGKYLGVQLLAQMVKPV